MYYLRKKRKNNKKKDVPPSTVFIFDIITFWYQRAKVEESLASTNNSALLNCDPLLTSSSLADQYASIP